MEIVTWVNSHLFGIMESLRWEKAPEIIKSSLQPSTPEPVLEFQRWGSSVLFSQTSVVGQHIASPLAWVWWEQTGLSSRYPRGGETLISAAH